MSGTVTTFSVGLHCWNWTHVPAFGTLNTPAHLVGFGPLDEEVHALRGPADILPGRLEPSVKTLIE